MGSVISHVNISIIQLHFLPVFFQSFILEEECESQMNAMSEMSEASKQSILVFVLVRHTD